MSLEPLIRICTETTVAEEESLTNSQESRLSCYAFDHYSNVVTVKHQQRFCSSIYNSVGLPQLVEDRRFIPRCGTSTATRFYILD
ncbi:unnamed protein product [Caenorhabditis nigoni]